MSKRSWAVWSAVGVSLLGMLAAIAYLPVHWSWESRTIETIGPFPMKTVCVRYSWVMQKLDFLYRRVVRKHAANHGFTEHACALHDEDGFITEDYFLIPEPTSQTEQK